MEHLHQPLREFFSAEFDQESWLKAHEESVIGIDNIPAFFDDTLDVWEMSEEEHSLWNSMYPQVHLKQKSNLF